MTELETKYQKLFKGNKVFEFKSINHVNHNPHPYMIGPAHVVWASDHFMGRLGEDTIRDAEKNGKHCAMKGCYVPYDEHKSDHVIFIQLKCNYKQDEYTKKFIAKLKKNLEIDKIDGISFVETPEKYRLT